MTPVDTAIDMALSLWSTHLEPEKITHFALGFLFIHLWFSELRMIIIQKLFPSKFNEMKLS